MGTSGRLSDEDTTLFSEYVVYDRKRNRVISDFKALSDEVAFREYDHFVREIYSGRNWEVRPFGRFYLFRVSKFVDGKCVKVPEEEAAMIREDYETRLDWQHFWMDDPPENAVRDNWLDAEFKRLDALDVARIEARANRRAVRDGEAAA